MPHRAEDPLTFHWPDHGDVSLALPAMIVASVLVHLGAFFLFRVPGPEARSPFAQPPVGITLIAPELPGCNEMIEWLGTRDPIRESRISEVLPPNVLQPMYSPSYAKPRSSPQLAYGVAAPTSLPDTPMIMAAPPRVAPPPVLPVEPVASRLTFSPEISTRGVERAPTLDLTHPAREILRPVRFMVALEADGSLGYLFRLESSGNPRIDSYVERYLERFRFAPVEGAPRVWGFARFDFGTDAYRQSGLPVSVEPIPEGPPR